MNHKNPNKTDVLKNLDDILARVKPESKLDKSVEDNKPVEQTTETVYKGCRIVDNVEADSYQIFFNDFPNQTVRHYLKHHGFDWSASEQCWHCKKSGQAKFYAEKAIDKMKKSG